MTESPRILYTATAHVTSGRAAGHAMGVVGRRRRQEVGDVAIDSHVMLLPTAERGFALAVDLDVTLPSVDDPDGAAALVLAADQICPYSNATRGNADVALIANGRPVAGTPEPRAALEHR